VVRALGLCWAVWGALASLGMGWTCYTPEWEAVGGFEAHWVTHDALFGVRLLGIGMDADTWVSRGSGARK
jgi:hypothetical protein